MEEINLWMDEIVLGTCWHMRGTRERLPRSLMEGTDGKKGLADAAAVTLPRAAAPGNRRGH